MRVAKFGGACFRDRDGFDRMSRVLQARDDHTVVVASALYGVTDSLIDFLEETRASEGRPDIQRFIKTIRSKHMSFLRSLVFSQHIRKQAVALIEAKIAKLEGLLHAVQDGGEIDGKTSDLVLSMGERLSVILVEAKLMSEGFRPRRFETDQLGLITDGRHGDAQALLGPSARELRPSLLSSLDRGELPVVTGYIGRSLEGHTTTLGRSGTDLTATVVGYSLGVDRIDIWKMVDGFLTADPELLPSVRPVRSLSYEEASTLCSSGARVLHPRSIEPARRKQIPIVVKNLLKPDAPGTVINSHSTPGREVIKSLSHKRDFCLLKAFGNGSASQAGTLEQIKECVGGAGVDIYSTTASQRCIVLLLEKSQGEVAQRALEKSLDGMLEHIEVLPGVALICIVGEGLTKAEGVMSRVCRAAAAAKVSRGLTSVGASPVALHFAVRERELVKTMRAIHQEFFQRG